MRISKINVLVKIWILNIVIEVKERIKMRKEFMRISRVKEVIIGVTFMEKEQL